MDNLFIIKDRINAALKLRLSVRKNTKSTYKSTYFCYNELTSHIIYKYSNKRKTPPNHRRGISLLGKLAMNESLC